MWNWWGLKCEQCGDVSPKWWPKRDDLRDLVRLWPRIEELRRETAALEYVKIDIASYVPGESVDEFLWNHYEHGALVLCDESGRTAPLGFPTPGGGE